MWVVRVDPVGQDRRREVKADGVHDDHGEDQSERSLLTHDQMQAGVQHDRLAGDHGIPADSDDGDGEVFIGGDGKELEHEAEGVQGGPIRRDEERPKVKAAMSLEGEEDLDVELDDIIPGDGSKGGNGHVNARRGENMLSSHAVALHLGRFLLTTGF